ncbi:jg18637, partial [Pararge aegeria aegeria]
MRRLAQWAATLLSESKAVGSIPTTGKCFFEWLDTVYRIVQTDMVKFLEAYTSLSPRYLIEDAVNINQQYAKVEEPIQALRILRKNTKEQ